MAARLTEQEKLLRLITERQFQSWMEKQLTHAGWLWYHAPDNVPRRGFIQNIKAGFPDLVAVKGHRVLWIELKRQGPQGVVSPAQLEWHEALRAAGQEVYVWRPEDREKIPDILSA